MSKTHVDNVRRGLGDIAEACGFKTLRDLDRQKVLDWASESLRRADETITRKDGTVRIRKAPGLRTINAKLIALTAFGNWLVDSGRLIENPFDRLKKLDESDDVRRRRLAAQGRALAADDRLVQIPAGLIRILDRDLAAAGIPKVDERGRRLDVHAT